jgi:hypothetical protein
MSIKIVEFFYNIIKKDDVIYKKMETNKDIISRLKFISRINKGEKINVRYMYVQPDDILTKISRTFYRTDNRRNTLMFIRETIDRSFEIINSYNKSEKESDKIFCEYMIIDIKDSKKGINNFKDTYITDTYFCCQIDTIIQDIDTRLLEIKN